MRGGDWKRRRRDLRFEGLGVVVGLGYVGLGCLGLSCSVLC